jgi:NAD(P)-dependent dehydrogenase (short-subunit alcohol dehydrogenase family)
VASAAGLVSGPDLATYNVAKAGVISLSETLKVELADQNIDVTVSCPTVFKSHLLDKEGHEGDVVVGVTAKGLERAAWSKPWPAGGFTTRLNGTLNLPGYLRACFRRPFARLSSTCIATVYGCSTTAEPGELPHRKV